MQQYQRDGRLWRGLTKGVSAFARTLTAETMSLVAQLAMQAQSLLEMLDQAVAPAPTSALSSPAAQQAFASANSGLRALGAVWASPRFGPMVTSLSASSSAASSPVLSGTASQPLNDSSVQRSRWTHQPRTAQEGFRMVRQMKTAALNSIFAEVIVCFLLPFLFASAGAGIAVSRCAECGPAGACHPGGRVRARRSGWLPARHAVSGCAARTASTHDWHHAGADASLAGCAQRHPAAASERERRHVQSVIFGQNTSLLFLLSNSTQTRVQEKHPSAQTALEILKQK